MKLNFSLFICTNSKEGKYTSDALKKLKDLAEYIYETESLYIAKHGGFKLLEISSIETKLCNIRQEERERKEEDEKQVKKRVENKR